MCRAIFRGCAEIEFFGDIFTSATILLLLHLKILLLQRKILLLLQEELSCKMALGVELLHLLKLLLLKLLQNKPEYRCLLDRVRTGASLTV